MSPELINIIYYKSINFNLDIELINIFSIGIIIAE